MRKPVDGSAIALMVMLCMIWGFQQVAIKAVAADIAPTLQVAIRSVVSALLVWLFSRLISQDRWLPGPALRSGLVAGLLFGLEFLFIAEGLRRTYASHMTVFVYTAPMFAAIGLHFRLPDERLSRLQWVGVLLAFGGIAIAFLVPGLTATGIAEAPDWLLGDFLGLCAGLAWGATTVVIRTSRLSEAPATQTLFYQLLWAFALLLPFALLSGQGGFTHTPLAWSSLIFQILAVSFGSFLVWFWLLRRYLASRLGVLSFMTPLFGVLFGVLLLGERLEPAFIVGALLVLTGLLLVNGLPLPGFLRGGARR